MTKKILSALLASMLVVSCAAITANAADEELAYYVEAEAGGNGTEDSPFSTIEEAILELNGQDGTIYIYGDYNMTSFKTDAWDGMVTIAGATKDSIITVNDNAGILFTGDITFKNINFAIGKYAHFNPNGTKLIMDAGEGSNFEYMMHLSSFSNAIVEEAYFEINSGIVNTVHAAGGYSTSLANGVMGDSTIVINGGEIKGMNISADSYMDTMTGIAIGGNLNIIYNGGKIGSIGTREQTTPDIMGALNIIFNNGMEAPEKFVYPETAAGGTFIIKSEKGGMITPTADAGVFNVKADAGKVAVIDGKQVFNGTVELEAGETEVKWVDGEQPATEEKKEIKLTIGSAEIVTNGEAKALDVPAQIIDSRTMVPLRAIFEALGASVEWDDATKTVTSERGETKVSLTVGKAEITVNGAAKELDVPGQIVDSRTLVPVRAIAEAFGCDVAWDDATKTVTITE